MNTLSVVPKYQRSVGRRVGAFSLKEALAANPLLLAGGVALGAWGLYELTKPKKSVGKVDTNTLLLAGAGVVAVVLLTRKTAQAAPPQPVYIPTPTTSTSGSGSNVWSALEGLFGAAEGIFGR